MRYDDGLVELAQQQHGLLTRRQLHAAGTTRSQLRWALGRTCRLVLPGVVATFTGELDAHQRLVAGCLWAGPSGQLAGSTAAHWHGVPGVPDDGVVRLLVGWGDGSRREGFAVRRRTRRLDAHPWQRGPLVICSRARAVADAARQLADPTAVRAIVIAAVQERLVRERDLRAELEAGAIRGSAMLRAALSDVADAAWSAPEAEVLRELARSTVLPRVWANPRLTAPDGARLPTPDFWLDDVGIAGQVHSRAFHLRDQQWEATVAADTALAEHGITIIAVTPSGFRADPAGFRRRVERAYRTARDLDRRPRVAMDRSRMGSGMGSGGWA